MTDNETNVMPLRQYGPKRKDMASVARKRKAVSSAIRTRRYRERQKERQATVTPSVTVTPNAPLPDDALPAVVTSADTAIARIPVTSEISNDFNNRVTHVPRRCAVTLSVTVSALALATVSAGFGITGMTSIFVGSFWPVITMGVALQCGKLSAVAWLARYRAKASWRLRTTLGVLVAALMTLNAIGAYGFLAKAHIGHAVDGDVAMAGVAAEIDANVAVHTGIVADLDRRIQQIDHAVDIATAKGRTSGAMVLAEQQRKARAELVAQRTAEAKTLAALHIEHAKADGARRKAEADLGPVKYLATLLGAKDDDVLRWFILVVALLLDPAAVLLLAAASARRTA